MSEAAPAPGRTLAAVAPGRGSAYVYDAFATYATAPDRDLVRALEAFAEGFHHSPALPEGLRRELELCVSKPLLATPDGSILRIWD